LETVYSSLGRSHHRTGRSDRPLRRVLAPTIADRYVQIIDVADLAAWVERA
jgi:hypothetical protein